MTKALPFVSTLRDHIPPPGYFANDRQELVVTLPRPIGRVLDVGCGEGGIGRLLRALGAERLVGIELDSTAAAEAREAYDELLVGSADKVMAGLDEAFDTILYYDVLEHLADPWSLLADARRLIAPNGHLHVSLPNARHVSMFWDLIARGTFGYSEWGHRDRTHLRWFTRRDITRALEEAGWEVVKVGHPPISSTRRLLDRLTRGRSTEFLVWQWHLLARVPHA